jgi:hypothetical protein
VTVAGEGGLVLEAGEDKQGLADHSPILRSIERTRNAVSR